MRLARLITSAMAVTFLVGLGGCEGLKEQFGIGKNPPDEFAVVSRAPLAIPPDFGLRPPAPGAPRPQEGTPSDQARRSVLGTSGGGGYSFYSGSGGVESAPLRSAGESEILNRAGATDADPNIRLIVDSETDQIVEDDKNLVDLLVFWRNDPPPADEVDPQAEADRLRENAALGKDVTEGETPIIKRRKKGLLEGMF